MPQEITERRQDLCGAHREFTDGIRESISNQIKGLETLVTIGLDNLKQMISDLKPELVNIEIRLQKQIDECKIDLKEEKRKNDEDLKERDERFEKLKDKVQYWAGGLAAVLFIGNLIFWYFNGGKH